MMKYCEQTTCCHPLCRKHKDIVRPINDILRDEGWCKAVLFDDEKAIDLDRAEMESRRGIGSRQATVDLSIGIVPAERVVSMLLVELKLKVDRPENITSREIRDKIKHSRDLLGSEIPICRNKIFVFKDSNLAKARNYIARIFNNRPGLDIEVMGLNDLKKRYFE